MKIIQGINGKEIAVIEGDTHISKWVEQSGRLDHDQSALRQILPHIPVGGVVVDGGAFIGDHTVSYAERVGPEGFVYAFEINPAAFECLRFNTKDNARISVRSHGLSHLNATVTVNPDSNAGASWAGEAGPMDNSVLALPLDFYELPRLDFMKLDIEGWEVEALMGAAATIWKCRPVIVLEVNEGALQRQGRSGKELLDLVKGYGYTYRNIYEGQPCSGPQYDIICFPKK